MTAAVFLVLNKMEYYNLIFAVSYLICDVWTLQLLVNGVRFFILLLIKIQVGKVEQ